MQIGIIIRRTLLPKLVNAEQLSCSSALNLNSVGAACIGRGAVYLVDRALSMG